MIPSAPFEKFHNLQEGDVFELGGIHVVIYELPGHTGQCCHADSGRADNSSR